MKVKRMIKSDVDTFKVGDIIKVKLTDGVKVQAMSAAALRTGQHYRVRVSRVQDLSRVVGGNGCL